jgi:Sec-independent protein translocase protein TatA
MPFSYKNMTDALAEVKSAAQNVDKALEKKVGEQYERDSEKTSGKKS